MKWLQRHVLLSTILIVLLLTANVSAITAKIGNARVVLYPELDGFGKTTVDRTIKVINDNDVPINVSLVPSSELKDIVKIIDKEMILQPGTEKDARFQLILSEEGKYEGTINVLFNEIEVENGTQKNGVALASKMIIYATKDGRPSGNVIDEEVPDAEFDEEESNNTSGILSNVGEKFSPAIIILTTTTIVSFLILLYLLSLSKKRKDNPMIGVSEEVKSNKPKRKPQNETQ